MVVWTRRRVFSTTWWACRTPMLTSSLVLTSWPGKWRFHRWQILGMCITLHSQIINFINRVPNDWRHFTIILLHTSFHFVHEKITFEECRKIYYKLNFINSVFKDVENVHFCSYELKYAFFSYDPCFFFIVKVYNQ